MTWKIDNMGFLYKEEKEIEPQKETKTDALFKIGTLIKEHNITEEELAEYWR